MRRLKAFLRLILGIQSPSKLGERAGAQFIADFQTGMDRAAMGPHGPPLQNEDGSLNPEGVRIFLEETGPLIERMRPAARAATFWYEEEDTDE